MRYQTALAYARRLQELITPGCARIEIVGSVKRADKPEVHDIELLVIPDARTPRPEFGQKVLHKTMLEKVLYELCNQGILWPVKGGEKYKQYIIQAVESLNPFHLDLFIVRPDTWGIQNVIRTGPSSFSRRFVTNVSHGGLLPDKYKYIRGETRIEENGVTLNLPEEQDALALLRLGWIEPGKRKNYTGDYIHAEF